MFLTLFISHVSGCFFFYLATTVPEQPTGDSWIGSIVLGSNVYAQFRSLDLGELYTTAVYWATFTMATIGGRVVRRVCGWVC